MKREHTLDTAAKPDTAAWALVSVGSVGGALIALIAVALSLLPFRTVFAGTQWMVTVGLAAGSTILAAALVMALGELWQQRSFSHRRGVIVGVLAQLVGFIAGTFTLATQFNRPIPNPMLPWRVRMQIIVDSYASLTSEGMSSAYEGHPPVTTTPGILWLMGLVAIMLSLVYLTTIVLVRTPVVALIVALVTASVPFILVGAGDVSLTWLASAGLLTVALLATRVRPLDQPPAEHVQASPVRLLGVATSVVAATLVAAVVASAVTMPRPAVSFLPGKAVGLTLTLGDDLRVPVSRPVLEVETIGEAPYLRIGTLTNLVNSTWIPDPISPSPIVGIPERARRPGEQPEIRPVNITPLASAVSYAPVPYPLVEIAGLSDSWQVVSQNLTVRNEGAQLGNTNYSTKQEIIEPTWDEIENAQAVPPMETYGVDTLSSPPALEDLRVLGLDDNGVERELSPGDSAYDRAIELRSGQVIPQRFRDLAVEVTADAASDVEKAQAIERYLRNNFDYSLTTPVEQGFDGSDVAATERFLDVRAGYCVHFASAFTLMARSVGLPTRIVVGYLPGTYERAGTDDKRVYQVYSDQAHSWPEVHFADIGWVSFEPTATIGSPTSFSNPTNDSNEPTPTPSATPTQSATPTPTPTQSIAPTAGTSAAQFWPVLAAIAKVAAWLLLAGFVLAIPALRRALRRKRRTRLMTSADAPTAANASWQEVRDTLVDAGLSAPAGETIRQFGKRMRSSGVSAELIAEYTQKLEDAAYKPEADVRELSDLTQQVRTAVIATASRGDRRRAVFAPRSLRR